MPRVTPTTVEDYLTNGCGRCNLGGTPQCKVHSWSAELKALKSIVINCGLIEEIKWDVPCYTYQGKNICIVSAFKEYASISFFKGALIQDASQLLEKPGENSQSARLIKFTDIKQIIEQESKLKAYLFEAIEIEKAGLTIDFKEKNELVYPEELENKFAENPDIKSAFEALTTGRQRGYILHFSQPKQSSTRESRIEKCIPKILEGKGFHDR
ncbi:YdeI family protein [Marinoscillum sp. MHG1-6]|uniref:YdeI/OmpD-associated family protein n=1 Tax=Marinoscillum sp. MHG1-6 TaxID=2959627 RepID=UPI00215701B9|nr:YdeI/OmpD-associated family protein [Marinoscillum sp. MHG1-6]